MILILFAISLGSVLVLGFPDAAHSAIFMVTMMALIVLRTLGIRFPFLMAENADDLRCAQWVIAQGSAKRGEEQWPL